MKKYFLILISIIITSVFSPLFGQNEEYMQATIKDIVETHYGGLFCTQGIYDKTYDKSKLLFTIEDDGYIIPVRLIKKDLGAETRFQSFKLQQGDTLVVEGRLDKIDIQYENYKCLNDARIIDIRYALFEVNDDTTIRISDRNLEVKPSFKGGDIIDFSKWVYSKLKYPKDASECGIDGQVKLQFTIRKDGRLTDIKVINGVYKSLDKEAIRVISQSPKWEPGYCKGKPVNVVYTFPVIFKLR